MADPCTCPTCGQPLPETGLVVDMDAGIVVCNGRFAHLTETEFEVFNKLASHPGRVVRKDALHAALYSLRRGGDEPLDKIVDVYICKLRPKIRPLGIEIENVWGRGYKIVTRVEAMAS